MENVDIEELGPEILKQEIDLISQKVNHFDDLRHRTKQLAISLWLAAVGAGLTFGAPILVGIAVVVPLPFWWFDATYHGYQEGFATRLRVIADFLRTGKWEPPKCPKKPILRRNGGPVFPIPDYYGERSVSARDHSRETSVIRNAVKLKALFFYGSLVVLAYILFRSYEAIRGLAGAENLLQP